MLLNRQAEEVKISKHGIWQFVEPWSMRTTTDGIQALLNCCSHFFRSSHSIRTCFFFLCCCLPWVGVATAKVAMGGASPHDDDALGKRQGKGGASCDSK